MHFPRLSDAHHKAALRIALSHYVANGLSAALGLLLISGSMHLLFGAFAAAASSVGVVVCIPPDQPAPQRGKFWQLLPGALIGLPLFFAVQLLHASPIALGLLLVPASFLAFLAAAWGKRGLPIAVSMMFAMVFSMAVPDHQNSATTLSTCLYFAMGAGSYLLWATLANAALNARYRVQMLADSLLSLAHLMRTQAQQFAPGDAAAADAPAPLIGRLLQQQAALADQLQAARDILLEAPRTPRRQQLASMLMAVLEMRDHLLICELDLDTLKSHAGHAPVLGALSEVVGGLADEIEDLADDLLRGRAPQAFASHRTRLASLQWADDATPSTTDGPSPAMLALGLAHRVGHLDDETLRLIALARGEAPPDIDLVRTHWGLFVSPTAWSWQPFIAMWRWDAPPLRHAIRAALAIGTAYAIGLALPWGTHDYWILLTIVVVLRGSLAQTLERRNHRVAGTAVGCVLAGALLATQAPPLMLLVLVTLSQAVAHAFAVRRYLITSVAATVLGLLQAHMLNAGVSPGFEVVERLADTLLGVAIAWAFSYVLPSWERQQIPALVRRSLAAQARHARVALGLGQLQAVDNEPELQWRLARREAYDSLSALVQATQRSLSEPRAVRPPLEPLGRLLARSYQLLAQLTTVKTMLLQRRGGLTLQQVRLPMQLAAQAIDATLTQPHSAAAPRRPGPVDAPELADPFASDLSPWLLRRLDLAGEIAGQLRSDADQVLG
jgi:uncharacterized membrane protein YccC